MPDTSGSDWPAVVDLDSGPVAQVPPPSNALTLVPVGTLTLPTPQVMNPLAVTPAMPASSSLLPYEDAARLVRQYESGGNYNVGFGGQDLSKAPLDANGFPIWEGKRGPAGISHAAGAYEFEPSEWARYAKPLGITDFSPESQDKVFRAAYAAEGFKPWAQYNKKLAAAIGQAVPAGWQSADSNQLTGAAAQTQALAQTQVQSTPKKDWQPPPAQVQAPAQSPWMRLMALSAMLQNARVQPVQVHYDPRAGMVSSPREELAQAPATTGALPTLTSYRLEPVSFDPFAGGGT